MLQNSKQVSSLAGFQKSVKKPIMHCKPKHLEGVLYVCTHAYIFNITRGTAESKLYTIRARNTVQVGKFLEPSSDKTGMGPAKRYDSELENPYVCLIWSFQSFCILCCTISLL